MFESLLFYLAFFLAFLLLIRSLIKQGRQRAESENPIFKLFGNSMSYVGYILLFLLLLALLGILWR